jgi:hypothetical protein
MISLSGVKSDSLIEKIKSHEQPPWCLESLFGEADIDNLRAWAEVSYSNKAFTQEKLLKDNSKPLGNMAHPQGEVRNKIDQLLRTKLTPFLDQPFGLAFTFHRNYFPYGTHTDSGYDSEEWIYKQGIIPLEVDPPDADVYTVIFEQKAYHSLSYPGRVETIRALKNAELEVIHGLDKSLKLSDEQLDRYFQGSTDRERFLGFQIALPFHWTIGNMALWDRAHLHCSSDFQNHKVKGKMGLMWISWRL